MEFDPSIDAGQVATWVGILGTLATFWVGYGRLSQRVDSGAEASKECKGLRERNETRLFEKLEDVGKTLTTVQNDVSFIRGKMCGKDKKGGGA